MSEHTLSQAEVESLLSSMDFSGLQAEASVPPDTARPAARVPAKQPRAIPYDFKRPERVGKEQMRSLQSLYEGFARSFGAAVSGLLRGIVDVKLTSVDQLTYSEFVFSLENPTCFNLLTAEPLEGNLILDMSPSLLYPIIDRLLGGGKEVGQTVRRPLTEIELRLVGRLTGIFLSEMERAWENVLPLKLAVERVESNPQLVQIVPPNDVVILISLELTMGDVRGMINLCMPFNAIERISGKLNDNTWFNRRSSNGNESTMSMVRQQLRGSQVELVVTLARSQISTGDLLGLRVGDIITTESDARDPLEVQIEGIPKFQASPGVYKGKKAVQVQAANPTPAAMGTSTQSVLDRSP